MSTVLTSKKPHSVHGTSDRPYVNILVSPLFNDPNPLMAIEDRSLLDKRLLDDVQSDNGHFSIDDDADARRAFRAMKAAEHHKDQLEAERDEQIDEINDFYDPKVESQQQTIDFLKEKIQQFVRATGYTLSTPSGKAYTQTRTKWRWADRDDLVAFAEDQFPDLVQTSKTVSKNDLKQAIKDEWDAAHEDDPDVVQREAQQSVVCYTQ